MSSITLRRFPTFVSRNIAVRQFSATSRNNFISNLFGSKDIKQREEIVKNQDDFEIDPNSKIVILNKDNSPKNEPFSPETDMPDFKINQWKFQTVLASQIESTYTSAHVSSLINETYQELKGIELNTSDYATIDLHDLAFRFQFAKLLQQKLGFNINDFVLTKSHNLEYLYQELMQIISTRWVSERNPNGIVLRPEDFTSANIYLNQELNEEEREAAYNELVEKAKDALN